MVTIRLLTYSKLGASSYHTAKAEGRAWGQESTTGQPTWLCSQHCVLLCGSGEGWSWRCDIGGHTG